MNNSYSHTTPVLLLTGYLGSGKTTLVNHILTNKKGIRFAVIVNDIGEVNIDATLIQKGGVVGLGDDSLVALQNGCICCTLKMDLVEQLSDLMKSSRFDYIVIEASGICEPEPIARTICTIPHMGEEFTQHGIPRLDSVVTVVDALRMQSEFACGDKLLDSTLGEEDIENLIIQQIEFCNIVLLNKVSEVKPDELGRLRQIVMQLNPGVKIVECDYAKVDFDQIVNTHLFHYEQTSGAAGWVRQLERLTTEEEEREAKMVGETKHHHNEEDETDHHHHKEDGGHHHHLNGEVEEYGIGTFVYYRRQPFDIEKFDRFVNLNWPKNIIRAKGICYFSLSPDMSYLFEQAGVQVKVSEAGQWFATMPKDELLEMMRQDKGLLHDWDEEYGDRMQKIVFIGQKMDTAALVRQLDACLDLK